MAGSERSIYLVGFMGSGKTTVGEQLAALLGWNFVDTDQEVEKRAGIAIAEIFESTGEPDFRRREIDVLRDLQGGTGAVIATGGGLFCRWEARRAIRSTGRTVWLDINFETAMSRVGGMSEGRWLRKLPTAASCLRRSSTSARRS